MNSALLDLRTELDVMFGPPMQVLSDSLRGFLVAAPGKKLIVCDFSSIEARVIAWLAGQESVLEMFRDHGKLYEHAASGIYRVPLHTITKDDFRRQVGKVAILALGYQGGVGALQNMGKGYGVKFEPTYEALWASASLEQKQKSVEAWTSNGKSRGISREEFLACELVKLSWRAANPEIVKYWWALEDSAKTAILNPGHKFNAGALGREVTFLKKGSFLWCRLPSGRVLCYPYPKMEPHEMPWKSNGKPVFKECITYMTELTNPYRWDRVKTYGGSISENVTQAVSRDLLAEGMIKLESRGYPVVVHVHDEVVIETDDSPKYSLKEVSELMCLNPPWATDLPLGAGGFEAKRYRK